MCGNYVDCDGMKEKIVGKSWTKDKEDSTCVEKIQR